MAQLPIPLTWSTLRSLAGSFDASLDATTIRIQRFYKKALLFQTWRVSGAHDLTRHRTWGRGALRSFAYDARAEPPGFLQHFARSGDRSLTLESTAPIGGESQR